MSENLTFPLLVAVLMESELDAVRQKALSRGQLDEGMLIGMKIYRAVEADPPFITEGQLGVGIGVDRGVDSWIFIIYNEQGPAAVVSSRYTWQSTTMKFSGWDDINLQKMTTLPTSATQDALDSFAAMGDEEMMDDDRFNNLLDDLGVDRAHVSVGDPKQVYHKYLDPPDGAATQEWYIINNLTSEYWKADTGDDEEVVQQTEPATVDLNKLQAKLLRAGYKLIPRKYWPDFVK